MSTLGDPSHQCSIYLPVDWLQINLVGRDVPLDMLQSDRADRDETVDMLQSDRADRDEPVDLLKADRADRDEPVDLLQSDRADRDEPVDMLQSDRADRDEPVDMLQSDRTDRDVPLDMLQVDQANTDVSVDILQADQANTDESVDMLQAEQVNTDVCVDMLQADQANTDVPVDMLQSDRADRYVPVDMLQSDLTNRDVPVYMLQAHRADRDVPVDMLQSDRAETNVLVDMLQVEQADGDVPVDMLQAHRADRDVPVELLQSDRADIDVPVDMLQAHRADRDVPVDMLQSDRAETYVLVDMLQAEQADGDVPVDMMHADLADLQTPSIARKMVDGSVLFCWVPYVTNNKKTSRLPYQCDYCGTRFSDLTEMCFHRTAHGKVTIYHKVSASATKRVPIFQKTNVSAETNVPFFQKTSESAEKTVPLFPEVSVQTELHIDPIITPPDILAEQKQINSAAEKSRQREELRLLSSYVNQLRQFRRETKGGLHKHWHVKLIGLPGWTKSHSQVDHKLLRVDPNQHESCRDAEGTTRKLLVSGSHDSNTHSSSGPATLNIVPSPISRSEFDTRDRDSTPIISQKRTHSAEYADRIDKCPDLESTKPKTPENKAPFEFVTSGETSRETAQLARDKNCQTEMQNDVEVLPEYEPNVPCKCQSIGRTLKSCDLKKNNTEHIQPTSLNAEKSHLACEYCGKNFPTYKKLVKHRRSLEKKLDELLKVERANFKEFVCDICHEKFAKASQLTKHKKMHVSKTRKLLAHSSLHSATSLYSCAVCHRGYTKASRLARHQKKHSAKSRNVEDHTAQPQVVLQTFPCDVCSRVYTTASSFNRHRKKHALQKSDKAVTDGQHIPSIPTPLKCETCARTFTNSTHLAKHKQKHTASTPSQKRKDKTKNKEQRLVCGVCQKKYRQVCSYANHWQVHLCNPDELAAHLSKDSHVQQLTCVVCDRTFETSARLDRHRKQHVESSSERLTYSKDTTHVSPPAVTLTGGTTPLLECGNEQTQKAVVTPEREAHADERLAHACTSDSCCRSSPTVSLLTVCTSPHCGKNPKSFLIGTAENISKEAQKPTCDESFTCDDCCKKTEDSTKLHQSTLVAEATSKLNETAGQVKESNGLLPAEPDLKLPVFEISQEQLHQPLDLVPTQDIPTVGLQTPPAMYDELSDRVKDKENGGELPRGENGARSPSSCHECDKIFRVPVFLKIHKRIHSGEKLHTCVKCGKGFLAADYLRTHARVHS